jgi:tetratricopeptide (TPR) repeat protein
MNETNKLSEEIFELNKKISLEPKNVGLYLKRARIFSENNRISEAISDYTTAIELSPADYASYFFKLRGNYYLRLKKYNEALRDYKKAINIDIDDDETLKYNDEVIDIDPDYKPEIKILLLYFAFKEHEKLFEFFDKIEYELLEDIEKEKIIKIAEYYFNNEEYEKVLKIYLKFYSDLPRMVYKKFLECLDKVKRQGLDEDMAEIIAQIAENYYDKGEYDKAFQIYYKLPDVNIQIAADYEAWEMMFKLYEENKIKMDQESQKQFLKMQLQHKEEIKQKTLEERNKIIADLSHSIKNLISTVIDPLENLREEKTVQPAVIRNALRGANLIREIVNAMNLSYTGSIEDFYSDVRHNTGKDRMDLQEILVKSLLYAVGNMFDGKYFSNFVRRYFPSKSLFEEAKSGWTRVSQATDTDKIIPFMEKHFFETEFDLRNANKYAIGNEKGSAVKLLILFQEIILNAVKYSAFANKEKRFLHIRFTANPEQISIRVDNCFKEKAPAKTTGLGHVIIENFARLLRTKPEIRQTDGIYSVEINFENFWERKNK